MQCVSHMMRIILYKVVQIIKKSLMGFNTAYDNVEIKGWKRTF